MGNVRVSSLRHNQSQALLTGLLGDKVMVLEVVMVMLLREE